MTQYGLNVWFDMIEGFEDKMRSAVQYLNQALYVPPYDAKGYNRSQFVVMTMRLFKERMVNFSPDYFAKLEEQYRVHRTHKTQKTSVNLNAQGVEWCDHIADWLSKNTTVRHIYHGDSPNRKLIALFAIYHLFNEMETSNQQG